jgi:hypothetical protein
MAAPPTPRPPHSSSIDHSSKQPPPLRAETISRRATAAAICPQLTIFAFGQTGSGKTHTMRRVYARATAAVLQAASAPLAPGGGAGPVLVGLSFFEIYGNKVYDLLARGGGGGGESFLRVHWVDVPKALRARRVNRRRRRRRRRPSSARQGAPHAGGWAGRAPDSGPDGGAARDAERRAGGVPSRRGAAADRRQRHPRRLEPLARRAAAERARCPRRHPAREAQSGGPRGLGAGLGCVGRRRRRRRRHHATIPRQSLPRHSTTHSPDPQRYMVHPVHPTRGHTYARSTDTAVRP